IGRGALIKPWIFTEIKERRLWDISAGERLDILRDFVNYGLENWGSDDEGVTKTRRFLLEWLSFLHRYIPVGVLERLPQRINERPPPFVGRTDLETLLSSGSCNGCGAPTAPCIPFPFMKSTCCSGSCYWFRCRDYFWDDPNFPKDEF
ncbi:unnamed protein product, partial [Oppiella nova]